MQEFALHLARRAGCGGFNRYSHSAVTNLEDWRTGGLGKGKFGLEHGCLGAGKWVPGRSKWVLGLPNWRQNGSQAANIGAWRVPGLPKLSLGWSRRRFGGLSARLDGHLGGPRAGLDAILGPLGRLGRCLEGDFGGIWGSQTSPERRFWIRSGKAQNSKIICFPICF